MWFNFHYPQSEEATPIDQYLVCGPHYKTIRDAVAKVIVEGKLDRLDETCEVIFHRFTCWYLSIRSGLFCVRVYMSILLRFCFFFIGVRMFTTVDNRLSSVGTVQRSHHCLQRRQCQLPSQARGRRLMSCSYIICHISSCFQVMSFLQLGNASKTSSNAVQFSSVSGKYIYLQCVSLYLQQVKALTDYIQTSKFLAKPEVKAFAQALVTNQLGPLAVHPRTSGAQCMLMDLTIHLAAVLLCGNQGILAPLQQLAMAPANMQVYIP